MNCIVIDDETLAREIICHFIHNDEQLKLLGEFDNPLDAIRFLNTHKEVDVIFLDVHMPAFTGFDFLQTMPSLPAVILTTSDRNLAIEAFEYHCIVDFLAKPVKEERFKKAVLVAKSWKKVLDNSFEEVPDESSRDLFVNIDNKLIKIDIPSIEYIRVQGQYLQISAGKKSYTLHITAMADIESKLPAENFLRIHKTVIINIGKVLDIEEYAVAIAKQRLPLSNDGKEALLKKLKV